MKVFFAIIFMSFSMLSDAQSIDSIRKYWQDNDLSKAKETVDAFVLENLEEAKGWLLKAGIYNSISSDNDYKDLVTDGRLEAFKAIQKATDVNQPWLQEQLQKDNYQLIFDIYKGYTNDGVAFFNAGAEKQSKEDYARSIPYFKKAAMVGSFISQQGWGLPAIDTNNLYYTAKAAIYAERKDEALLYSKRIADANISTSQQQKGFEQMYQWLVFQYRQKKDAESLEKYSRIGVRNFPFSPYFELNYIDWLRESKNYPAIFSLYKKIFNKGAGTQEYQLAYIRDMFNFVFEHKDSISTGRNETKVQLEKELTNYSKKYPADVTAKLLQGKFYINEAAGLQYEQIKRSTIDKKVMAQYKSKIAVNIRKSIIPLKDIADNYPQTDKLVYKEALGLLIGNLTVLKLGVEVKKYQAMMN